MVIERYDTDLQKLFEQNNRRFPDKTVYQIGLSLVSKFRLKIGNGLLELFPQIIQFTCLNILQLDVLEYIHTMGYIHGDIKPANLLLGRKKGTENQVSHEMFSKTLTLMK